MYDVLLRFSSKAQAQAALPKYLPDGLTWDTANVVADVKCWQSNNDVVAVGVDPFTNLAINIVTHVYYSGYFVWVSVVKVPTDELALPQLVFCYDRDALKARQPKSVIKASLALTLLKTVMVDNIYAGADIPWGELDKYM